MKRVVLSFVLTILLGACCFLYAYYIEPFYIEETELTVTSDDWKGRLVTFVVLSDLHVREGEEDYLREIVQRTMKHQPDAVLMLGDYVESTSSWDELANMLKPLSAVPCYLVLGNHDYYVHRRPLRELIKKCGFKNVQSKREELTIDGKPIHIAGFRCISGTSRVWNVKKPEPGIPYIVLTHSPTGVKYAPKEALITLAGHTHGGQVCFPWNNPLYIPDVIPMEWTTGKVNADGKLLYVSRGLGYSKLPLRFCCRPELLILRLKAGK